MALVSVMAVSIGTRHRSRNIFFKKINLVQVCTVVFHPAKQLVSHGRDRAHSRDRSPKLLYNPPHGRIADAESIRLPAG